MHPRFKVLPRGLKIHDWEILNCELEYTHSGRALYPVKCLCGRRYLRLKRDLFRHKRCIQCSQKHAGIKRRKIKNITNSQRSKLYNRWTRLRNKNLIWEEWKFDFNKFCEYVISLPNWSENRARFVRKNNSKLYEPDNVSFVVPLYI